MDDAGLYPGPGQPGAEGPVVMFASRGVGLVVEGGTPKFSGPDHEGVLQQSTCLEILQERRNRLVHVLRQLDMVHHVAVGIPVPARPGIDQLHEPYPALDEAPRCETLPGEPFRASPLQSIEVVSRIALSREVKGFRRSHLHAKGGLETLDAGLREGVTAAAGKMLPVQATQCGKLQFLARHSNPRLYVGNGLRPRHHQRALVCTGKEVTRVNLRPRIGLPGRDGNEGRQVLIKRPQPIADPRPDTGPCESKGTGMHAQGGVVVVRMIGMHRPDQGDIVDAGAHLGKERAHFRSTLPEG